MPIRPAAAKDCARRILSSYIEAGLCTDLMVDLAASMIRNAVAIDENSAKIEAESERVHVLNERIAALKEKMK
jgi:hypothetical protein